MTITYPLDFPDVPIASSRFGLNVNQAVYESSLSRKRTVQAHAAGRTDRWEGVLTTAQLTPGQLAGMTSWLVSLRGLRGTFRAFDPDRRMPRGVAASTASVPVVAGGGQTGRSIATAGWQADIPNLLLPGDYISIGNQYFMVLEPVDGDSGGGAAITVEPAIRISPADSEAVVFDNPTCLARVTSSANSWETDMLRTGVVSIAWEEVL